jgi:hypothetical protein
VATAAAKAALLVPLTIHVKHETTDEYTSESWDTACGRAIREALDGATSVTITDTNGLRYNVWAEPVEDNS